MHVHDDLLSDSSNIWARSALGALGPATDNEEEAEEPLARSNSVTGAKKIYVAAETREQLKAWLDAFSSYIPKRT